MSHVVWQRGFRPLFLLASLYAAIAIGIWAVYLYAPFDDLSAGISPHLWHAHEMIYGYAFAVIAGFLLTAVRNWTDSETASPHALQLLCASWLLARLAWLAGADYLIWAVLGDLVFTLVLLYSLLRPIIAARQWRQSAVMGKVLLLGGSNAIFYLSLAGAVNEGFKWSLQGAIYIIIALILTIARRVFPFFIERGLGSEVKLFNARWLDLSSLLVFVVFFLCDLAFGYEALARISAALMSLIVMCRLVAWYDARVWQSPLLWSLLASLAMIALGFLLYSLQGILNFSLNLPLHTLAIGGIGALTTSMMARVSIGHTGRNLRRPPSSLHLAIALLIAGGLFRSVAPIAMPEAYTNWLLISSLCWIGGFSLFAVTFMPILLHPRVDGKQG